MAKKKIDTSKLDLSLGRKRPIKKTASASKKVDSDEVVKQIHPEAKKVAVDSKLTAMPAEAPKEMTRRITLDIPVSLHKKIKVHVFEMEKSMKQYFLDLAKKDLKK